MTSRRNTISFLASALFALCCLPSSWASSRFRPIERPLTARPHTVRGACSIILDARNVQLSDAIHRDDVPFGANLGRAVKEGTPFVRILDAVGCAKGEVFVGVKGIRDESRRELLYFYRQVGLPFRDKPNESIPKKGTVSEGKFTCAIAQPAKRLGLNPSVVGALIAHHQKTVRVYDRFSLYQFETARETVPLLIADVIGFFDQKRAFTHIDQIGKAGSAAILKQLSARGLDPRRKVTIVEEPVAETPEDEIPRRISKKTNLVPEPLRGMDRKTVRQQPIAALEFGTSVETALREDYQVRSIGALTKVTEQQLRELPVPPSARLSDARLADLNAKLGALGLTLAKPRKRFDYNGLPHEGMIFGVPVNSLGLSAKATRELRKNNIHFVGPLVRSPVSLLMELSPDTLKEVQVSLSELHEVLAEKRHGE